MAMPSIGSMRFLTYDGEALVGICGVYVDDFIIAGTSNGKMASRERKVEEIVQMGKWETDSFTLCGVRYLQKKDFSVKMDQQEFIRELSTAEFNLPKICTKYTAKAN